jgi:pimeloyl-ACP methyl ester carboxylesterase
MAFFEPSVSFRKLPKGGDVQAAQSLSALTSGTAVLLLIHGYNNDQSEASDEYEGWKRRQNEIGRLNANAVGVYWPGDRGASNALLNVLFYMQALPKAQATAPLLADALRRAANLLGTLRVRIIAHSLGARVTMELLEELNKHPQPNLIIEKFVVMAAAVATGRLGPKQPFRTALDLPSMGGFMNLFSEVDPVLRFAFGPGEALGGEGLFLTALGHQRWTGGGVIAEPRLLQNRIDGAHHGDYWAGDENNQDSVLRASTAARFARQFLDLGPMARLVASATTPARATEPQREVQARVSTARTTPSRDVAA